MTTSESDRVAIAAHLHVLLRRKTGRVTDTEWMASNHEYAVEVVRFAREHARTDDAPELADWADRLESAMASLPARHAAEPAQAGEGSSGGSALGAMVRRVAQAAQDKRYVGGLR